jgi:DNA-binding MurR/RpiR family transcriptional regulator
MKPVSALTQSMLWDAVERLVAGRPRVTDGRLTVANLAREAGVGRSTANRATNVLDAFHVSAARVPVRRRPETDVAASRSRDAAEIAGLKATVNQLAQQVQQLAVLGEEQRRVIASLHATLAAATAGKVVPFPPASS